MHLQAKDNTFYDTLKTDLGMLVLFHSKDTAVDDVCLVAISIPPIGGELSDDIAGPLRRRALPDRIRQQLIEYFQGKRKEFDIPYRLTGGDFDLRV